MSSGVSYVPGQVLRGVDWHSAHFNIQIRTSTGSCLAAELSLTPSRLLAPSLSLSDELTISSGSQECAHALTMWLRTR
ncbi:hypothetical protein FKM82_018040 [Ascaphus truei]